MNEIIKCKICGKIFFKEIASTTIEDILYDFDACLECNKLALKNTTDE